MNTRNIAIFSAVGVAAVAVVGTGTALVIRRRNKSAAQTVAVTAETEAVETVEESVAAGAEAFLADQESAITTS